MVSLSLVSSMLCNNDIVMGPCINGSGLSLLNSNLTNTRVGLLCRIEILDPPLMNLFPTNSTQIIALQILKSLSLPSPRLNFWFDDIIPEAVTKRLNSQHS